MENVQSLHLSGSGFSKDDPLSWSHDPSLYFSSRGHYIVEWFLMFMSETEEIRVNLAGRALLGARFSTGFLRS